MHWAYASIAEAGDLPESVWLPCDSPHAASTRRLLAVMNAAVMERGIVQDRPRLHAAAACSNAGDRTSIEPGIASHATPLLMMSL